MKQPSRILKPSDHARLITLWETAGLSYKPQGRDSREAFARQMAGGRQAALGIEDDEGTLIGSVLATHDGRKGWINRLAVHPDCRRNGLALQLIGDAEAWLREQGIEIMAALIEPGNEASVALFEAAGYEDWPGIHYMSKRDRPDI